RLERGRVEFKSEPLELGAAVARVVAHLEERARQERIRISCDIEPGLYVVSDPLALDVVVRNILENALAAVTPLGGGSIALRARRGRGPGRAFLGHLAGGAGAALMSRAADTRVLVVEDDPHLGAGVMENLRAEGYEVSTAGDGEQALEWLRERGCALIVLDVMLPGIDGFGVCRTLREQGNNTPVLFLTARGGPVDRVRGLESGRDDC